MGQDKIGKPMKNMTMIMLKRVSIGHSMVKFGRDGEGVREALDMGNCSINI